MAGRPYVLAETNLKAVPEGPVPFEVVVLPWGATEAHNYHLPYGTDTYESAAIANEAARIAWEAGEHVVALPGVPFGVNTGQLDLPGTINMNPSTQMALLTDVAESLDVQGVPKLVIMNGHGGNDFRQMIRELQPRADVLISVLSWYTILNAREYFDTPGDHGGELETSLMMHLHGTLVRPLSEAGSGASRPMNITAFREGWAWTPREWTRATVDTGVGDPSKSTAEKGARYFEAVTKKVASFLIELAQTPVDKLYAGE